MYVLGYVTPPAASRHQLKKILFPALNLPTLQSRIMRIINLFCIPPDSQECLMKDLKKSTLQGLLYLGIGKGAGKVFSFAGTLILARLLTPQDYGLMALVMVVIGIVGFFNEIGLGSAIKQRAQITSTQLSGCFTLSLLISTALYTCLYVLSPSIAAFYGNEALSPVLRFIALTFITGATITVPDALMARNMQFKLFARIDFAMVLIQTSITLVLAWLGYGVWALACGFVFSQIFKTISTYFYSSWRPSKLGEIAAALELMRFGLMVTYSRVTWYFYNSAQTLIIGRTLNPQAVGIYSMAETLAFLPTTHITSLLIQVASPLFSKMQHDLERLNKTLLRLTSGVALINFPVMIGMSLSANEVVTVLLGPQWLEAILPLQILCIAGLLKTIDPLLTQALISTGQVNITARFTSLCALTIPSSIFVGSVMGGLLGAAGAMTIAYFLSSVYLFFAVRKRLGLFWTSYFRAIKIPLEGCACMAVFVLGMDYSVQHLGLNNTILILCLKTITGALAYMAFLIYLRPSSLQDCHEVLCELGIPAKKLQRWPFSRLKIEDNK